MSLRDNTKVLFADTLKDMLKRMPLDKVRVDALCRECGADRRSFYYHFKDKYDLVAWIYLQDYEASLRETAGKYCLDHVVGMLQRIQNNEVFYRRAFSDKSQNTITQYINDMFVQLGKDVVSKHLDSKELSREDLYAIKSYTFACVGHTKEWLEGKSAYTPLEFANLQYRFMPEILRQAYGIE